MLEWVLDATLASRLAKVVLVLGHEHENILQVLGAKTKQPRLQVIINRRYPEGQSRSLQAGLAAVRKAFDSVMFLLGDQPGVRSHTIDYLLNRFWDSDKPICVPAYRGVRGNPTIFSRAMYGKLMAIEGDIGARNLIFDNPEKVLAAEMIDSKTFIDIDSPEDLAGLQHPV